MWGQMKKKNEIFQLKCVYRRAKTRCTNPNISQWNDYGGRGIKFNFLNFDEFIQELGPRPSGYTLERIDNDGNYEVGNVKWATRQEQGENKRTYKTNKFKLAGVSQITPTNKYKTVRFLARTSTKLRKELYKGPDFFEACCARKSWEETYVGKEAAQ